MSEWSGWRLTFNCGHHQLTDLEDRVTGQLATCDLCPLAAYSPRSPYAPARPVRAMRMIVAREPVTAPRPPEWAAWGAEWWYGT